MTYISVKNSIYGTIQLRIRITRRLENEYVEAILLEVKEWIRPWERERVRFADNHFRAYCKHQNFSKDEATYSLLN